jgi:hypothetical protein
MCAVTRHLAPPSCTPSTSPHPAPTPAPGPAGSDEAPGALEEGGSGSATESGGEEGLWAKESMEGVLLLQASGGAS